MSFDLKFALTTIAPTLATMLGGPLAGTAVAALEGCFGLNAGAGEQGVSEAIAAGKMTPEVAAQMRARDQEHAEKLRALDIDLAKLNADHEAAMAATDASDRDSARKREISVRGLTTPALAWTVVGASVALGIAAITGFVTKDVSQQALVGTVVGYVFSEAKQVLAYYFGSSWGSDRKTELQASKE